MNEYTLLELICRTSDVLLTEFDSESKALIFKNLSKCEFAYNHPKYRYPGAMYHLKTNLKENLNQLSEGAV